MIDSLGLSKKDRKILIEKMRDAKELEREVPPDVIPVVLLQKPTYVCPKCKNEVEMLTYDHRIPKWLYNQAVLNNLGFSIAKAKDFSKMALENKLLICQPCNSKKGGKLDYTDALTRKFVRDLITIFWKNMDAVSVSVKIPIICKCNEV